MTTAAVELRRSNAWFECDRVGKHRKRIESTKELWTRVLLPQRAKLRNVIEIGLCEAASTIWLMENFRPDQWVGIDPWRPGRKHHAEMFKTYEQNFWHNISVSGAINIGGASKPNYGQIDSNHERYFTFGATNCKVAKSSSHDYLRGPIDDDFNDHSVDLLIVDGDHSAVGCLTDLVLGWRKLKPGGLIVLDDFDRRWHNARPNVHEAVLAFWNCFEHLAIKEVETKKHVVIRRKLDG